MSASTADSDIKSIITREEFLDLYATSEEKWGCEASVTTLVDTESLVWGEGKSEAWGTGRLLQAPFVKTLWLIAVAEAFKYTREIWIAK